MPKKRAKRKKASSRKKTRKTARKKTAKKKAAKTRIKAKKKAVTKKVTIKKQVITPAGGKVNMVVTYDPQHRATAESEIMNAFKQIKEGVKILKSEVDGVFKLQTSDARSVVGKLRNIAEKQPEFFTATHHYTPIDAWTKSEIPHMQNEIKKLASSIGNEEKWKMTLNKRLWDKMEGTPLIIKLTEVVKKPKVDLENPQKIVQVEIIGKEAGISLLKPEEYLDLPKIKG